MNSGRGSKNNGGLESADRMELPAVVRRMENMLFIGTVFRADYDAGKVRVRIGKEDEVITGMQYTPSPPDKRNGPDADCIETDWIPWIVPRACWNTQWDVPEIEEQVLCAAPSGNLTHAIIIGRINKAKFPHDANTPDIHKAVWREPETAKVDRMDVWNRLTGSYYSWIKEAGEHRIDIGDRTSLIMDKDHVEIRVGTTKLVMTEDTFKVHIKGRESEFKMTPDSIIQHVGDGGIIEILKDFIGASVGGTAWVHILSGLVEASVKSNGVVSIRENTIQAKLEAEQVRIGLFETQIKAWVQQTWLHLMANLAELRTPGSALTLEQALTTLTTPQFRGVQGAANPAIYESGDPAHHEDPAPGTPKKTKRRPDPGKGNKPYRPKKH